MRILINYLLIATFLFFRIDAHIGDNHVSGEDKTDDDRWNPEINGALRGERYYDNRDAIEGIELNSDSNDLRRSKKEIKKADEYNRTECLHGDIFLTSSAINLTGDVEERLIAGQEPDCLVGNVVLMAMNTTKFPVSRPVDGRLVRFITRELKYVFGIVRVYSAHAIPQGALQSLEGIQSDKGFALEVYRTDELKLNHLQTIATLSCTDSVNVDDYSRGKVDGLGDIVDAAERTGRCPPPTTRAEPTRIPTTKKKDETTTTSAEIKKRGKKLLQKLVVRQPICEHEDLARAILAISIGSAFGLWVCLNYLFWQRHLRQNAAAERKMRKKKGRKAPHKEDL